jgi:hypothetical protein
MTTTLSTIARAYAFFLLNRLRNARIGQVRRRKIEIKRLVNRRKNEERNANPAPGPI